MGNISNLWNSQSKTPRQLHFTRQANKQKYDNNQISTTKYNIITFLPKALIIQFIRPANWVYLITAICQSIPQISSLSPLTAVAPLIFVLGVALIKQAIEDIKRYLTDKQTNNSQTQILINKQWIKHKWSQIQVGDFVRLKDDQIIPADMILLYSTQQNSICYVQTSNLDGQSNLKTKTAHVQDVRIFPQQFQSLKGTIQVQAPNRDLHQFHGTMSIQNHQQISPQRRISFQNLLVRGSMLKNTQLAVGVVVYTGHDTKIMKNQGNIHHKVSHVQGKVNRIQGFLLFVLIILSMGCAIGYYNYHTQYANGSRTDFFYLRTKNTKDMRYESFLIFFTSFLLLSFLIPVSMNVALEGIKIFQGFFIGWDKKMYYKPLKKYCNALNLSIIEQLGLVDYVLTDKTGTLTANQMKFQYAYVQGQKYAAIQLTQLYQKQKILQFNKDKNFYQFWLAVILCHDVVVDTKKQQFQGSSPDQVCFVEYAQKIGYRFIKRTMNSIQLEINGQKIAYQYIHMIPFSPRKRMSIIVRDVNTKKYWLYTKGADLAILTKAIEQPGKTNFQKYQEHLTDFSTLGLRTLVFSKRQISQTQMNNFLNNIQSIRSMKLKGVVSNSQKKKNMKKQSINHDLLKQDSIQYKMENSNQIKNRKAAPYQRKNSQASLNSSQQEKLNTQKMLQELTEKIQSSLEILGVSAIQDRLQDEVPQTIARLQQAGMVVMMITGDKLQTAQNIGYLSNFIRKNSTVFRLKADTQNIYDQVQLILRNIDQNKIQNFSVIIEGNTIQRFLSYQNENQNTNQKLCTVRLLQKCKSVIFCRSTPKQKAEIVKFVKQNLQGIVLAIGDGGNDIGMIQQANIGVGIIGKQGNQAAAVSDFYFAQFKYLDRLVLHHGRWAYYRMSYFFVFYGWKNLTMTLILFYFMIYSAFSGLPAMSEAFLTVYNTVIALILVTYYTVLEQDINQDNYPQCFKQFPIFYKQFKQMNLFSYKRYILWSILAIILSLLIHFTFVLSLGPTLIINQNGNAGDFLTYASGIALSLSASVIFVIIADMNNFTWFSFWIALILLTFLVPIVFFIIQNFTQLSNFSLYYALTDNFNLRYYAVCWMILSLTILVKFGFNQIMFLFWPNSVERAMHQRQKKRYFQQQYHNDNIKNKGQIHSQSQDQLQNTGMKKIKQREHQMVKIDKIQQYSHIKNKEFGSSHKGSNSSFINKHSEIKFKSSLINNNN